MISEFLDKQITIPLYRYEALIEKETRYNQLFQWQLKHGNDEVLKIIDNEKYKDETKEKLCCVKEESEEN